MRGASGLKSAVCMQANFSAVEGFCARGTEEGGER